jgi:hypothetical protein
VLSVIPLDGVLSPLTEVLGAGLGKAGTWLTDAEIFDVAWQEGAEGATAAETGAAGSLAADESFTWEFQ